MSREQKLALILGFLAVLVVAMLISDHYSKANSDRLAADVSDAPPMIDPAGPSPYSGPLASNTPSGNFAPLPPTIEPSSNIAGAGILQRALDGSDHAQGSRGYDQGNGVPEPLVLTQGGTNQGGTNIDPAGESDSSLLAKLRAQGEELANGLNGLPAAAKPTTVPTEPTQAQIDEAELRRQLEIAAKAQAAPKPDAPAAERWHIVVANDSLFAISKKYYGDGKYWKKLADANKGRMADNNTLRTGVRLLIPDAATIGIAGATPKVDPAKLATKPSDTKPSATKPTTPETKPTTTAGRVYEVKKGDTLGEISMRELGTSKRASEIIKLNGLKDANSIRVGQKLKLPAK